MRTIFTAEAKADLAQLRAYLQPLSAAGLRNVTDRIEQRIRLIPSTPHAGRPTPLDGVREVFETKYGFQIPYHIEGDTLFILRVYRVKRSPLDHGTLEIP